jgi:cation diffusion facilitator CzcD-associated flavoprotein CzcO
MEELASHPPLVRGVTETSDEQAVSRWLTLFEDALRGGDAVGLAHLFHEESHWRDLVAFAWDITPHAGARPIAQRLASRQGDVQARNFKLPGNHTRPRRIRRVGISVIEAIFSFETRVGRCLGLVRLLADDPAHAWVLMTSLRELKGHEEPLHGRRVDGSAYSREFGGDNWADRRHKEQEYIGRDPTVLIIGAGQAGLSTAARLRLLGVDALCVEKTARVGDVWRNRYHSLALHNQVALNHMAHLPFPPHWPKYLPKDMIGNWLETYAWAMECNVWTGTTFAGAQFDDASGHWTAKVRRADGSERVFKPRHLVFANGIVGAPRTPDLPGLETYKGEVMHTHGFRDGSAWRGKRALVLGVGTSGHDIAQDLYGHGADVSMIQRGSITVASVKAACIGHSVYYDEDLPTDDADLITLAVTYPLAVRGAQLATPRMLEMDKELLAGLQARGFKLDIGEDKTGHLMKVRRIHGGYYLNCGCSELIAGGQIGLIQYEDIDRFVEDGALMKDGRVEKADLLVTATGYQTQQDVVRELLGDPVADKIGPVWGLAADGELANMFRPTAQQGLWFLGSSFAQARIYSHFIALQIKAREIGLVE